MVVLENFEDLWKIVISFFDEIEYDIQLLITKEMVSLMTTQNEENKIKKIKLILEKTNSFEKLKYSLENIYSNNTKVKIF